MLAVALHRELLEVGGEPLQVLVVGQHRDGLGAEEVGVPDGRAAPSAPAGSARTAPCGSARPSRGSRPASRGTAPARSRAWSRGRSPSPSSSGRRPSPRTRTCWPCRCRTSPPRRRWSRRRRSASRRACSSPSAASSQSRAVRALVIVSSVVKVLDETMNSVSAGSRSRVASAKSVPSTLETKRNVRSRSAVVPQRLVGHHRPEIGAADPDVDDVPDALAGVAVPRAAAHAVGEGGHPVEHRVDLRAPRSRRRRRSTRRAGARSATCSTARSSVMLIFSPREHRVDALAQAALLARAGRSSRIVSSVTRCFE